MDLAREGRWGSPSISQRRKARLSINHLGAEVDRVLQTWQPMGMWCFWKLSTRRGGCCYCRGHMHHTSQPSPPDLLHTFTLLSWPLQATEFDGQINPKGWFLTSLLFPHHLSTSNVLLSIFLGELSIHLRAYLAKRLLEPPGLSTFTQGSDKAPVQTRIPALSPSLIPPARTKSQHLWSGTALRILYITNHLFFTTIQQGSTVYTIFIYRRGNGGTEGWTSFGQGYSPSTWPSRDLVSGYLAPESRSLFTIWHYLSCTLEFVYWNVSFISEKSPRREGICLFHPLLLLLHLLFWPKKDVFILW